ncbi:porin family protein [uncultured Aquimarina sp.]|uniref:hypothetical protein n=1 Tax=uncultured Aquimarina sp. TaxID=575652 RepID=UPI0026258170|nr:hypothetical protein [uncultured Aquimarina sp.]
MKKMILTAIAVFTLSFINAQDNEQTSKGKFLVEGNTNFGGIEFIGISNGNAANTGFSFYSFEDEGPSGFNIGAEAGYFIIDNLALKLGLGFGSFKPNNDSDSSTSFSYKIGAKYYIISKIPVQVDFTGASIEDAEDNPSFIGLQGGYALFLGDHISVEPGLRYNLSTDDEIYSSFLQLNVGFALHF